MSEERFRFETVNFQCSQLNGVAAVTVKNVETKIHQFGWTYTHSHFVRCDKCDVCGIKQGPDNYRWAACPASKKLEAGGRLRADPDS